MVSRVKGVVRQYLRQHPLLRNFRVHKVLAENLCTCICRESIYFQTFKFSQEVWSVFFSFGSSYLLHFLQTVLNFQTTSLQGPTVKTKPKENDILFSNIELECLKFTLGMFKVKMIVMKTCKIEQGYIAEYLKQKKDIYWSIRKFFDSVTSPLPLCRQFRSNRVPYRPINSYWFWYIGWKGTNA